MRHLIFQQLAFSLTSLVGNDFNNFIPSSSESLKRKILNFLNLFFYSLNKISANNHNFDFTFTANLKKPYVQTIKVANLTFLRSKNGQILVQQRGFRTKTFERRMNEEKSSGNLLSNFIQTLKQQSNVKNLFVIILPKINDS